MNVSSFYELRKRLYSCAAAGCSNVSEDFRLKKALEDFSELAQANKNFARLGDMCGKLFGSAEPAPLLADCIALADALAVAQGTFSDASETEKSAFTGKTPAGNTPYSRVSALCELIRKDSPKLMELPAEDAALAADPRVIAEFLKISNRNSYTLESFFRKIAAASGDVIVPLLKRKMIITDPKESGVRIKYISFAAGDKERRFYTSIAVNTEASNDLRAAAIEAMGYSPENKDILLTIYNTGKGKVKNAALLALAGIDCPETEEIFTKLTAKYKTTYDPYIARSGGKVCTGFALALVKENVTENGGLKKDGRNSRELFDLLANKPDADEGFLLMRRQYADHACDILIRNLDRTDRRAEFEELIHRLYAADKESFFKAEFYVQVTTAPDAAFADAQSEEHTVQMLDILSEIYYDGSCDSYCLLNRSSGGYICRTIFRDMPDRVLDLLSAPSANTRLNYLRGRIFLKLLDNGCKPSEFDRIRERACGFAAAAMHTAPVTESLDILDRYGDRKNYEMYRGMITDYVMYSYKNNNTNGYYYCRSALGKLPLPADVRIAELEGLLKKLKSPLNVLKSKQLTDRYINIVQNYLDEIKI